VRKLIAVFRSNAPGCYRSLRLVLTLPLWNGKMHIGYILACPLNQSEQNFLFIAGKVKHDEESSSGMRDAKDACDRVFVFI
jgi:hypothetical protein